MVALINRNCGHDEVVASRLCDTFSQRVLTE